MMLEPCRWRIQGEACSVQDLLLLLPRKEEREGQTEGERERELM